MKLLLVTTDPRVSADVRAALGGEPGLDLLEVRTPQRALRQLEDEGPFDVVVADNDTAPTGGFALAREVQALRQTGHTMPPVVLLLAREDDRWLANWAQPDAFMSKPIDPFDLHEVVHTLAASEELPTLPGLGVPEGHLPRDLVGIEETGTQTAAPLTAGP